MHVEPAHTPHLILPLTLLVASYVLCGVVFAQTGVSDAELRRCAAIERGVERLDCYDALVRPLGTSAAPGGDSASTQPTRARATAPADSATAVPSESATAVPDDVDAFGAELIRSDNDDDGIEEIESRIAGEFNGWRGNTIFRLENGQVWQQIEQTRFTYRADSPVVTIRRGTFGGYRLRVDGLNRSVRVRRLE